MIDTFSGEDLAIQTPSSPSEIVVNLKINGAQHALQIEPRVSLLDALREHLHRAASAKRLLQRAPQVL